MILLLVIIALLLLLLALANEEVRAAIAPTFWAVGNAALWGLALLFCWWGATTCH